MKGEGTEEGARRGGLGTASGSWQGAHRFSQIWRGPRVSQVSRFSAPSGVERLFSPPPPPGTQEAWGREARGRGPAQASSGGRGFSREAGSKCARKEAAGSMERGGTPGRPVQGLAVGRASDGRRSGEPGEAGAASGGARPAGAGRRSEESARATGQRGRCSKWRWGRAAGRAREEAVAAMTAASRGSVPAPAFPFPDLPDATEEREPGSLLLVCVLFRQMPPTEAEDARWTWSPRGRAGQGPRGGRAGPGRPRRV